MESKTVFDNYDLKTAIAGRGISAFTDGLDGNAVLNRAILIFLTVVVAVFAAVLIAVNKNNWLCCNYVLIISLLTIIIKQTLNSKILLVV
ncbi:MAG: hypothetical protein K5752_03595 [Succinivibrionaceae bacterium]|nr:hypothetical protein [Succinivibrionaceae bacterium]